MTCTRCKGLMVERPWWQRRALMWSCLNCGNCVDDTIRFNRAMAKPETEAQRNERIWKRVQREMDITLHASRTTLHETEVGC